MLRTAAVLAFAILPVQDGRKYCNSYKGTAPPELVSEAGHWINASEAVRLEKLKGRVVWLEFSFLDCGGCKEMRATMTRWHKEYASRGLVVIDVDNGFIDDKIERLRESVQKEGVPYAVLWDAEARNCATYGLKGYPCGYLLDVEGKVAWEGPPYKHVAEIEKLIQSELGRVKKEEK
jgi:thiol-disulfide isomerase/thioredoxin